MERTGTFGGFDFDVEVFGDYMAEQNTINTNIIASGVIREDSSIMSLIGEKGNVATIPFYTELDANASPALNNDGNTDNEPAEVTGGKQTCMLIQRMKAWKAQDFTRELTGANPMQHIAQQVTHFYEQTWQKELMAEVDAVLQNTDMAAHVYDITKNDAGKVDTESLLYAQQAAFGDTASSGGLIVLHSMILAKYKALQLVDYDKYTFNDALRTEVTLPRIGGMTVLVNDAATKTTANPTGSGSVTAYNTYLLGTGSFIGCRKTNYENPYYTDYDPETKAGIQKLYTKEGRVIHPNGFSFKADNVSGESPATTDLAKKANWERKFKTENIKIGKMVSLG